MLVDGEMYGDVVIDSSLWEGYLDFVFEGDVNVFLLLNFDVVNIFYNLLKVVVGNNVVIGLILLGVVKFVYVLMEFVMVCCIVNMIVFLVVEVSE